MDSKIKKLDSLFSQYVRLRDVECVVKKKCNGRRGEYIHPHHTFSRSCHELRWDQLNGDAVCADCHRYIESNRKWWEDFKIAQLGEDAYYKLRRIFKGAPTKKFARWELEEMIELYQGKVRDFEVCRVAEELF